MKSSIPRFVLATVTALLAIACTTPATTGPATGTGTVPAWTSASFTMHSWGNPLTAWAIHADGSGSWSESVPKKGNFNDRVTTTHPLPADPQAAAQLASIIARLPATAPGEEGCKERITDQPYGALTLDYGNRTREYRYNAGCLDAAYVRYMDQLRAADGLVAVRGRSAD